MSGASADLAKPSRPAPAFLGCGPPEPKCPVQSGATATASGAPPVRPPWRCPLSLMLALVSGLPICIVGFLAWGIPFMNLTAAIDPLSHSIRTLVFAILERDLTLTWANMRALVMAQRRLWDVEGQPMDAYLEAEHLARLMWPTLQSNSEVFLLVLFTVHGSTVHAVSVQDWGGYGPCVWLQNDTAMWVERWNATSNTLTGDVVERLPPVGVLGTSNGDPINRTTPTQPFAWKAVYHPIVINIGNAFSANVGLFDAVGRYMGRFSVTVSCVYLNQFLRDQLASQPATHGGRLALYDELGLVVAASHGTADQSRRYALTEIGDADLEAAGRLLGTQPGGWCPTNLSLDVRFSARYFLDVHLFADPVTDPTPLRWCAVLLSPRDNTMQRVDASVSFAAAFVCGTTFGATLLAVALGLLVTRPVQRLTTGMSALKACRFAEARRATGRKSVFSELFVAQGSYDSLVEAIDAFGKYVPATVVRGLLAGTIRPKLGMTEEDVVVAFMDVENFTHICETNPVEDIVSVTCQLFDTCCDVILRSQGTVDKFIGDCIMAMWGAPLPVPRAGATAVEALIEILCTLCRQPLTCGSGSQVGLLIGAHGGRCLVGNFGATARWDYTAVGDVVNAAARLGPLNKQFGTHCLISSALHDQATASSWAACCMRPMGDVVVVGKRRALAVFEVREQPVADREAWAAAVQHFGDGELDAAAEYFRAQPKDTAARAFLEDVEQTLPGGPYHRTMRSK